MHATDYDRAAILAGTLQGLLARDLQFPLSERTERKISHLVCQYVEELKALGFAPERAIIAVECAANEAGVFSTPRLIEPRAQLDGRDKLLVDMVRWCIEQYYHGIVRPPIEVRSRHHLPAE